MKSKPAKWILAVVAMILLVSTLGAGLWPVKSTNGIACGSFVAASSKVYDDAYQSQLGGMRSSAYKVGAYSENSLGLPSGAFEVVAQDIANQDVSNCTHRREVSGIAAGVLLTLALIAGAALLYLNLRERPEPATG